MTPEEYKAKRMKLLNEYYFLKGKRLYRSAAARVRKIAQLDFEYDGTPIEKTKQLFRHEELIKVA